MGATGASGRSRKPEGIDGGFDPEDMRAEKAPMLDRDDEMSEVEQGLNMSRFCGEVVEWLVDANVGVVPEVNET